jgi:hypothetical protein
MSKIFIEYKDFFAIGGHLYLVFQDNGGAEFVIIGGNPLSTGTIIMEVSVPIAQSDDYRGSETPQSRGQRELDLGGRTAEDVWDVMKQQATAIGSANLSFILLYPLTLKTATLQSHLSCIR